MTIPAVVTILDLATTAAATSSMRFEASYTTASGNATTVQVSLTQIMATTFGILPTGGVTGQLLGKASATDFSSQWVNISAQVTASTGIAIAGSTTIAVSLATTTPLSVLGVAGTATAAPLPIVGTVGQVLRVNDAGTAVEFGAVNLASSAAATGILPLSRGGWSTSTLTAFGVVYGNGTSTPGITAAGTTALPLVGQGTAAAPSFAVLTVPGGGIGTTTLTAFGVTYGNGTSTLGITAAGTTGWPLIGNGTSAAPTFQVLNVLGGGIGLTALATGDLLVASNNTTLTRLAAASSGLVLTANGTVAAPSYQSGGKFFGGRLTLQSGTPVMVSDATAQSTIFFAPYGGAANLFSLPTNATGTFVTYQFSQQSLNLAAANVTSGNLYDICLASTGGAFFFGHGPAWTSTTARSAAFTTVEGVWVNAAPITLRANATTTASIGTSLAALVGTFYATANGQTGMAFAPAAATGGNNTVLGISNAYNRVRMAGQSADVTTSWSYDGGTRSANGSNSNRVTFVDCLGQSFTEGVYQCLVAPASSAVTGSISVARDGTVSPISPNGQVNFAGNASVVAITKDPPAAGVHFYQALESSSSGTTTFFGTTGGMQLHAELEM